MSSKGALNTTVKAQKTLLYYLNHSYAITHKNILYQKMKLYDDKKEEIMI